MTEPNTDITFDDLREWNNGKEESAVVGIACSSYECPVATMLAEQNPGFGFKVSPYDDDSIEIQYWPKGVGGGHRRNFPEDRLHEVMVAVDEMGSRMPVRKSALDAILNTVEDAYNRDGYYADYEDMDDYGDVPF